MRQQDQEQVRAVLTALGLPALKVIADEAGIAGLEGLPGGAYTFAEALRLALEAFLTNGRGSSDAGHDSALDVVRGGPEDFGLGANPTDAAITEALRTMLAGDPDASVVLLTPATLQQPAYRFPPEYGESPEAHWVFRIIAPAAWPLLQWSIVDLRGEQPAYSYAFG
jgi:hypothetical protein